jgi:hypothetical protein
MLVNGESEPKVGGLPRSPTGFAGSSGLQPCSKKPASTPTWIKRMMKTAAKWDLRCGSGEVPLGTSGLGVFITRRRQLLISIEETNL